MAAEPRDATIAYPGGLRARWRWGGTGQAREVFALSEAGGSLVDLGAERGRIERAFPDGPIGLRTDPAIGSPARGARDHKPAQRSEIFDVREQA